MTTKPLFYPGWFKSAKNGAKRHFGSEYASLRQTSVISKHHFVIASLRQCVTSPKTLCHFIHLYFWQCDAFLKTEKEWLFLRSDALVNWHIGEITATRSKLATFNSKWQVLLNPVFDKALNLDYVIKSDIWMIFSENFEL